MKYTVGSFYKFFPVQFPDRLHGILNIKCNELSLVGSIIIASEGINGTVAGEEKAILNLVEFLKASQGFRSLEIKLSFTNFLPFLRMKIKVKNEIVTIGIDKVNPSQQTGEYVDAKSWNNIIKSDEYVLIDTRNDYEVSIGTFKNSENPKIKSFREFPLWWNNNKDKYKSKKVAMFCTGGIRCEKSTNYILQDGFREVVHLRGGILKYLESVPKEDSLWEGACFVFDQRVSVLHGLIEGPHSLCHACRRPVEVGDDEHELYEEGISCKNCYNEHAKDRRDRFKERQKQINLAKKRGYKHIGR